MMLDLVIRTFWFFLPAMFANMAPVFVKHLDFLDYPVDFHKKFRGQRILGSHKTVRGVFFAVLVSMLVAFLQSFYTGQYSIFQYSVPVSLLVGFLLGLGAMVGDMLKSFFKRQLDHAPGKPWFPFDQIDWALGAYVFVLPLFIPSLSFLLVLLVLAAVFHPALNYLGYLLRIKKSKW